MGDAKENPTNAVGGLPFWARDRDGNVLFSNVPIRPHGRKPNFILIGAAKSATTSLHQYLQQHPGVFMAEPKEPHFFSTDAIYERGIDWYKGLFADAKEGQICGEASTSYTRHPYTSETPGRIHEHVPDAKLIYVVREPVARSVSACMFAYKRERYSLSEDKLPKSVDEFIEEYQIIWRTSEYILQIQEYLKYFDRDKLLVILQDDIAKKPAETLRQVFEFVGADPSISIDTSRQHNTTKDFVQGVKNERAGALANKIPGYSVLKRFIPKTVIKQVKGMVTSRIDADEMFTPMSDEMREKLRQHFIPYNAQLREFLGRDLPGWD